MITISESTSTSSVIGQAIDVLDSPQLLIDLDVVDANLERMFAPFRDKPVGVRVHFKSLKCGGLASYIGARGADGFLCAKLNEAEVLADAGIDDILIANQVVGDKKMGRLGELAKRVQLRICVDDAGNVAQLSRAATEAGATLGELSQPAHLLVADHLIGDEDIVDAGVGQHLGLYDLAEKKIVSVPAMNSSRLEMQPALSGDGRLVAFSSDRPGGQGGRDIYLYDRLAKKFLPLPGLNSADHEQSPSLSADGRFLAFVSERLGGAGERDVYLYDRHSQKLLPTPGLNSKEDDFDPCVIVMMGK